MLTIVDYELFLNITSFIQNESEVGMLSLIALVFETVRVQNLSKIL